MTQLIDRLRDQVLRLVDDEQSIARCGEALADRANQARGIVLTNAEGRARFRPASR